MRNFQGNIFIRTRTQGYFQICISVPLKIVSIDVSLEDEVDFVA